MVHDDLVHAPLLGDRAIIASDASPAAGFRRGERTPAET